MTKDSNSATGLALGGGSVLGAAHIGVLKAFEENNIAIDYISGTSIGALVAALYAFGKGISELETIAEKLNWNDITEVSISKFAILSNDKMKSLLMHHIGDVNIEDSKIPLSIIATNIENGEKVILEKGSVANAVAASACIPGIFIPQTIDGKMLVDGGILENLPISPLEGHCEKIFVVDLLSKRNYKKPESVIDVLLNSFHYMVGRSKKFDSNNNILYISPDLSKFSMIKMDQSKQLIDTGYKETISTLDRLSSKD